MRRVVYSLGIILTLLLLTGCMNDKEKSGTKKIELDKYVGNYMVTFSDIEEELKDASIKEKISIKECTPKQKENCLKKGGDDNQLAIMQGKEDIYLSVPTSYLLKDSKTSIEKEMTNTRICFEWSDYEIFTQISCPPEDDNLFEKEGLDAKYYFRLSKETQENE